MNMKRMPREGDGRGARTNPARSIRGGLAMGTFARTTSFIATVACGALLLGACGDKDKGNSAPSPTPTPPPAPECPDHNPLRNAYFGDLHVHTAFSFDAVLLGVQAEPSDAYAFAKGAPMTLAPTGRELTGSATMTQLARPLDFTAVTDHAEFFGEFHICMVPPADPSDPAAPYNSEFCTNYRTVAFGNRNVRTTPGPEISFDVFRAFAIPLVAVSPVRHPFCLDNAECVASANLIWQETRDAARLANDRCTFTAFNGYEWTKVQPDASVDVGGAILHRNVIFRGESVPGSPITAFEAPNSEVLWARLQRDCRDVGTGCDAITIPHNTNQSNGFAFRPIAAEPVPEFPHFADRPLTAEDAEVHASFEPVVEIMQGKGASECRISMLSDSGVAYLGSDELCDFESQNTNNNLVVPVPNKPNPRLSFVREGLKEGLVQEEALGVNPFKLGVVGSTDTHNGTSGQTSDKDFAVTGHHGISDGVLFRSMGVSAAAQENNAGGLAVVWATENTREALFDAIKRKEVYATSGGRPIVRFFGSWSVDLGSCDGPDTIEIADREGVPMGADLPARPGGRNGGPRFVVSAQQDPQGAPLQRIQIVKGWLDESGAAQEAVYDVAGDPNNGASVDVNTCAPRGMGFASLCTVWEDPDFDARQRAFYYARVVDNPTCRWNQQYCADRFGNVAEACAAGLPQAQKLGVCCDGTDPYRQACAAELANQAADGVPCGDPAMPRDVEASCCAENYPEVPKTVQERAWTSPIWYSPS